jgi:hypothetical protein
VPFQDGQGNVSGAIIYIDRVVAAGDFGNPGAGIAQNKNMRK